MACSGVVARSKASVVFTTAFLSASRSSLALILCLSSESVTSPKASPRHFMATSIRRICER